MRFRPDFTRADFTKKIILKVLLINIYTNLGFVRSLSHPVRTVPLRKTHDLRNCLIFRRKRHESRCRSSFTKQSTAAEGNKSRHIMILFVLFILINTNRIFYWPFCSVRPTALPSGLVRSRFAKALRTPHFPTAARATHPFSSLRDTTRNFSFSAFCTSASRVSIIPLIR